MHKTGTLVIALLALAVVFAGSAVAGNAGATTQAYGKNKLGYYDLESTALAQMMQNKDFRLINVHIPYEGELADTDAFIAYDAIAQNLDKLPADKNAKIVLYCRSGRMSAISAKQLVGLGYTNVYDLSGGMNEWARQGNKLLKNQTRN